MIMEDFEDQLDLLNDDGDGVIEMSLLEEARRQKGQEKEEWGETPWNTRKKNAI